VSSHILSAVPVTLARRADVDRVRGDVRFARGDLELRAASLVGGADLPRHGKVSTMRSATTPARVPADIKRQIKAWCAIECLA
jgi:hypothetical protein